MSANNNREWPHQSGTITDHLITFSLSRAHHRSRVRKIHFTISVGFSLNKTYEANITKTKCKIRMSTVLTSLSWRCRGVVYNPNPASTLDNPNLTFIFSSVNYPSDPPSPYPPPPTPPPPLAPWQGTVHKHDTIF